MSKLKDGCYFAALGGCGEIGRNLNAYGVVKNGVEQWVLVDVGVSIEKNYGISLQIPLFDFLKDKNVIGVVCTHGHDDHIGALPYVMPELEEVLNRKIPIYATKFTMQLIFKKYEEHQITGTFVEVPMDSTFSIGNFKFELIYITHSIPEPNMVKMTFVPFNYVVMHTGDWKLDSDPVLGNTTDEEKIKAMSKNGIDVLICDSTNAMEQDRVEPEGLVKETMTRIIKENVGRRIIVSCFASNVARVKIISDIAKQNNRHVVLLGKSLLKMVEISKYCGYLNTKFEYYKTTDMINLDPKKTIVICTGSQGEKGSGLFRLAYHAKPPFHIKSKDLIIFSSRKIPGNEKEIADMQSELIKRGADIIDSRMEKVHVSGHPSRPEIERMIDLVKPKGFIPVHGQALQFYFMNKIAEGKGIKNIVMPFNGALIDLINYKVIDKVESGILGVDGKQLVNMDSQIIQTRKILGSSGAVFISVSPGEVPIICTYGVFPQNNYKNCLVSISKIVGEIVRKKYRNINDRKDIINDIIAEVSGFIRMQFDKNPLISVHIVQSKKNHH